MGNNLAQNAPFPVLDIRAGAIATFNAVFPTIAATGSFPTTGVMIADAPFPTAYGHTGVNSNGAGTAPFPTAVGYTGAMLSEISPFATMEATGSILQTASLAVNAPFPYMSAKGLRGVIGTLACNAFIGELSATGHIVAVGVAAVNAPFPSLEGRGSIPSDFSYYVLHNVEYGHIGKSDEDVQLSTIAGTAS
jgi:hypothetical protein